MESQEILVDIVFTCGQMGCEYTAPDWDTLPEHYREAHSEPEEF